MFSSNTMKTLLERMHSSSATSLNTPSLVGRRDMDHMSASTTQFRTPTAMQQHANTSHHRTVGATPFNDTSLFISQPKIPLSSPRRDLKGGDNPKDSGREDKYHHTILNSNQTIPSSMHDHHRLDVSTPFASYLIHNHHHSSANILTLPGEDSSAAKIFFYNSHFSGLEVPTLTLTLLLQECDYINV